MKSSMRKQIREIIAQHIGGGYEAKQKCAEEILRLFSVAGQSEQLACIHPYKDVYQSETECYCEKCGKDLTEAN